MTVYVCVPEGKVQDLDDHFVVNLGDGDEAVRLIMAAKANRGKVAQVGRMQAVMLEGPE